MATTVATRLPTTSDAPARARRELEPLREELEAEQLDDVRLIVSELVSNVVRHSGQAPEEIFDVEVTADDRLVRGRVTDIGPSFARSDQAPHEERSSWGLVLVDRIATRWGVQHNTPNYVWFELDLSSTLS